MKIHFPHQAPWFDGAEQVVNFVATVDGEAVQCAVTVPALQDHFGAKSPLEDDLLDAFERGLPRIHESCRAALRDAGGEPPVLRSGLFRIEAAAPEPKRAKRPTQPANTRR